MSADVGMDLEPAIKVARRSVADDPDIPEPYQLAVRWVAERALAAAAPIIAAQALRDAAGTPELRRLPTVARWLRDRANEIEATPLT